MANGSEYQKATDERNRESGGYDHSRSTRAPRGYIMGISPSSGPGKLKSRQPAKDIEPLRSSDREGPHSKAVDSYRKGGRVRKTGPALLHRGEKVRKKGRGKRARMTGRY